MDLIMNLGANIDMDKLPKVLLEAEILLTAPASGRSSSLDGLYCKTYNPIGMPSYFDLFK